MTRWEELYRLSYYTGVQMVRLFHRMGRFFTLVFLPIRLLLWRTGNAMRQKRARRRIREGFAGLRRRFGVAGDRVRAAWQRHPLLGILQVLYLPIHAIRHYHGAARLVAHTVAGLTALAVLSGTLYYWSDTTFALALTDDSGDVWGYVLDERVLQEGITLAKERLGEAANEVSFDSSSAMSLQIIPQVSILDKHEVCDHLLGQTSVPMQDACGVYIDGVLHGATGSTRVARQILDEILEESVEDGEELEAAFVETVELIDGVYPEEAVLTEEDLKTLLTTETEEQSYLVQPGDTLVSVTEKNDISLQELKKLNPTMGLELTVGQKLILQKEESHLRVQVSGTVQYETEIPYTVTRIPDATMYEGTEKVRVEGKTGINLVTATVTKINGVEQFSVITSSKIKQFPVMEVVAYGTKKKSSSGYKGGEYSNGYFIWPTPCTTFVSQQYGNEGHRGIDIWMDGMEGEDILAVDGGVVVMAGEYSGYKTYGKFIIIDHGNGYRTVYAHCSKLFVKEGDIVKQGERIALVGNTGRSTAPHLHLEVQRNGVLMNPMKFFK
ncbi:MAG: peptidoglycan DD-metalloendopeptidase family protein [Clostridia bacterium]|nr:peptidoglycan DD-metalloendopeptidase family protein [Clostridia bacterium]